MEPADYKFLTRTVEDGLYKRYEREGIGNLSGPERVVLLAWWTRYPVGNGGFPYFYQGNLDIAQVADAFQELGFSDAA